MNFEIGIFNFEIELLKGKEVFPEPRTQNLVPDNEIQKTNKRTV